MYYNNFGDEVERESTGFDAIIGKPDDGQYLKQSMCTGNKRVNAFPKKSNNEKTKNSSKDSENIKKENIASGNNTCCLSDSLGDFVNDARQIRTVIEAFDNEEFIKELQEAVNNVGHDPNCIFPYHINTRMIHIDNGKLFIDKVKDYIVNNDGIFAILTLDANPVLKDGMTVIIDTFFSSIVTSRIALDDFIKNWFSYDIVRDTIRRFVEKHQTLPGGETLQPVEEERDISEQTKNHVQRYMKNLHNGKFDREFNRSRRAEIGPGNPPDLSKEGILKAGDDFDATIKSMDEILFGGQSENTSGTSRIRKNSNKENNK